MLCPLHAVLGQRFHFASCRSMLRQLREGGGILKNRHIRWFQGGRKSSCEAGCSCWCSQCFPWAPCWKRRRWGTGTWYCKLMIKQVGQAAVWAERLLVVWRCLSTTVRCWKPLLFWVSHLRDQLLQLCISPLKAIIFWLISPSHHYHDHHRHHLHRLPVLVSLHHKVNPCLDSKCLFISSLFRSEKSHSSWIFLQNSDKNKLWTLNYLLYIIIQKGIPAMGCLNAVLDEGWGSYGRDYIGRCYRELCFQCLSSYCCIFCRAEKDMMASRQERWWAL